VFNDIFIVIITVHVFRLVQDEVEFDVVLEINNGKARQLPPEDTDVTVTEGDLVRITARAIGNTEGTLINGLSSEPCDSDGNVICTRRPEFDICRMESRVTGQILQYSFSSITLNETGFNITFILNDISRTVSLNGELIITNIIGGQVCACYYC